MGLKRETNQCCPKCQDRNLSDRSGKISKNICKQNCRLEKLEKISEPVLRTWKTQEKIRNIVTWTWKTLTFSKISATQKTLKNQKNQRISEIFATLKRPEPRSEFKLNNPESRYTSRLGLEIHLAKMPNTNTILGWSLNMHHMKKTISQLSN